ncbi:MAG: hypothetical protein A2X97_05590 [Bdellovibrionales bacterium GWA1_52_35]|nr:MAG: hypothetical protein A2X97_05590 [Bdellovibrionales bacterium GWA1_52_35]
MTKIPYVLAYDLGGTKVEVGVVDSSGKVLKCKRVPVVFRQGKQAVIRQLADLGQEMIAEYPKIKRIGIASAGPLEPKTGVLLDPTNFSGPEGAWGKTPLAQLLSRKLKLPVVMENDAAAAILAEHWVGAARKSQNAMILTLGTGLGTGIIVNGELVRAGRDLHPEAGHLILQYNDESAPCGCGNHGCAEAYLSGRNFTRRARVKLGNEKLDAKEIADMARSGDLNARAMFDEYSFLMAVAIHNYAVVYAPELVILTGSFAQTADLFMKKTKTHLEKLLVRRRVGVDLMPDLKVSSLHNNAGLIGGAFVAFTRS